ncbi:MAG TPA: hypothetical protein VF765_29665 [Polyangiaceae bacterium]
MWTKRAAPLLAMMVAAILAEGCKERAAGVTESQPEVQQQWAVVRRNAHGWTLHTLNTHAADLRVDDLDTTAVPSVEPDDAALVVHGTLRDAVFEVDAAFRGVPGAMWSQDDVFVQLKDTVATQLNLDASTEVPALDLSRVESDWLDHAWLENRVHARGAVLAGQFIGEPGGRGVLGFQANEVFVPLPDRARECPRAARFCPRGMVRAYRRDVDRCLVPDGCVEAANCASEPPACPSGFVLRTWRSAPHGCREYVCDPSFLRD